MKADFTAKKPACETDLKRPQVNKVSNSNLLASVVINGQVIKLMIDTGSASTLLSTSTVNKLFDNAEEVQPTETSCNLTSVDGTALDVRGKLDLQFGLGELMF